jgi:SH3 domain protein
MRKILLPLLLVLAGQGFAATGWISDELYVPLRAGEGNQYKILHRGLKSGTAVEILEQVEGSEWTKVRYGEIEGYINSQYVMKSPTADIRLAQMEKKYEQTREQLTTAQTQLREVTAERDRLAGENKSLDNNLNARSDELDKLKEIAADPVRLDQANRKLNEELV